MYDSTKKYKNDIVKLIKETWNNNPYLEIKDGGIYPIIKKNHNLEEIDHTDGIGTKGIHHWQQRTFQSAVQDALAMNVNDLLLMGAKAYKLQCHLMLPEDNHQTICLIICNLVELCKKEKITITGGETSIHHNIKGMELSLTVSGVITEPRTNLCQIGDILIGIPSNGIHSNGFTLINELFESEYRTWMTEPTRFYNHLILERKLPINAIMHITGGAYAKLKDVLPKDCNAKIKKLPKINPIFKEIYSNGATDEEMYKTFNCGFGLILSVSPKDFTSVCIAVGGYEIGEIVRGNGEIVIDSVFNQNKNYIVIL